MALKLWPQTTNSITDIFTIRLRYPIGITRGSFPCGQCDRGVKLTIHLHLVLRLVIREA